MKTLVLSKFIFYHETIFFYGMNLMHFLIHHSKVIFIHQFRIYFLFKQLFFGREKKRIEKSSLKLHVWFFYFLTDEMKICFYIFRFLRGEKYYVVLSYFFPSIYTECYVPSKFICCNTHPQDDSIRRWSFRR